MRELWREKASFKRLDEKWRNITEILPYERLYETLTTEQLRELLWHAKRLRWQALDLHRCGLETLPPELGDLPDLRFLDLGNGYWGDTDKFKDAKENAFSILPDSVGNLANLQYLYLRGTPLKKKLPPEIRGQSAQEVIHAIFYKCGRLLQNATSTKPKWSSSDRGAWGKAVSSTA